MTGTAPTCALSTCRKRTRHPSGRCEHHRAGGSVSIPLSIPKPVIGPSTSAPKTTTIGDARFETWPDGHPDLDGHPTSVQFDRHGQLVCEQWVVGERGELSRVDGPAERSYDSDGSVSEERWFLDNELHREDGPASISYYPGDRGQTQSERWFHHGTPHRSGGPDVLRRDHDGSLRREEWHVHGKLSRIDGPALLDRRGHTAFDSELYYFEGRNYSDLGELLEVFEASPSDYLTEHVKHSALAPLLDRHPAWKIVPVLREGVLTPDGVEAVLNGAPVEWARAFEASNS